MKFNLLLMGAILLVIPGKMILAQSDSALSFTMVEAQNYAIENYYQSKNAKLDIDAAKKKIWETTAIGLPQVSATGDFQYYLGDLPDGFPITIYDEATDAHTSFEVSLFERENISYGGTVSQLIFSGEYIVGLQASKVYKLLSEENFEKVKIDLKESISGTYFTLLILEENKRVITETLANLNLNLNHSRKTYEAGLIDDTEVDQLDLTVKRTENDLSAVDNQIETMAKMLKYQMGLEADSEIMLTDSLDNLLAANIISETAYTFDLESNIDYKMMDTQEKIQNLSLRREKALLLPTLSGFYNYSGTTSETAFTPPNHLLGLSANWTIFQSGMRTAKIAQAKIALEQTQNMKEQESERLIFAAQQAKYDYNTALTRYNNEEINYELSKKVFDKMTARYQEGFVSSLDLSMVNNQYLGAQLSYALSIQQLLSSKVSLDKAFSKL